MGCERKAKKEKGKRWFYTAVRFTFFVFPFSFAVGCRAPAAIDKPQAYHGPTEPMADVVAAINANNAKIPTLWANVREFEASIVDDKGKRHDELLRGTLLYRSGGEVRVIGIKDPIGEVVQIGSSKQLYWLVAKDPGPNTAWWGRYKYLGSECAQPIPIRPDLLIEVLGVGTINTDFNQPPVPVMRFNPEADAYMFVWNAHLPDRWIAVKEVWYDRQTKRPTRVALFDRNGRTILGAFLSNFVPVDVPNVAEKDRPMIASEYKLFFPDSGSHLRLKLDSPQLSRKGAPSDATFRFDPQRAGVSKVIQLDEACGP